MQSFSSHSPGASTLWKLVIALYFSHYLPKVFCQVAALRALSFINWRNYISTIMLLGSFVCQFVCLFVCGYVCVHCHSHSFTPITLSPNHRTGIRSEWAVFFFGDDPDLDPDVADKSSKNTFWSIIQEQNITECSDWVQWNPYSNIYQRFHHCFVYDITFLCHMTSKMLIFTENDSFVRNYLKLCQKWIFAAQFNTGAYLQATRKV